MSQSCQHRPGDEADAEHPEQPDHLHVRRDRQGQHRPGQQVERQGRGHRWPEAGRGPVGRPGLAEGPHHRPGGDQGQGGGHQDERGGTEQPFHRVRPRADVKVARS